MKRTRERDSCHRAVLCYKDAIYNLYNNRTKFLFQKVYFNCVRRHHRPSDQPEKIRINQNQKEEFKHSLNWFGKISAQGLSRSCCKLSPENPVVPTACPWISLWVKTRPRRNQSAVTVESICSCLKLTNNINLSEMQILELLLLWYLSRLDKSRPNRPKRFSSRARAWQ